MSKRSRTTVYARDLVGRGGRQFVLPWGPGKTCSTIQAGDRLGVCHDTVRAMCESGELQGWPIRDRPKSPWRVSVESIEDYIAKKIAKFSVANPELRAQAGQPTVRTVPKPPTR